MGGTGGSYFHLGSQQCTPGRGGQARPANSIPAPVGAGLGLGVPQAESHKPGKQSRSRGDIRGGRPTALGKCPWFV